MAFQAKVFQVLIASPSDVSRERELIPNVAHKWNAENARDTSVVLLPVKWETHSTPEMGDRAQAIINRQLVADCDILIGVFWTKLGTPTGSAASGTAEEIDEFMKAHKPVMLYFCSAPVPQTFDANQYLRLQSFKDKCYKEGLAENYGDLRELEQKIYRHLTSTVRRLLQSEAGQQTTSDAVVVAATQVYVEVEQAIKFIRLMRAASNDAPPELKGQLFLVENPLLLNDEWPSKKDILLKPLGLENFKALNGFYEQVRSAQNTMNLCIEGVRVHGRHGPAIDTALAQYWRFIIETEVIDSVGTALQSLKHLAGIED